MSDPLLDRGDGMPGVSLVPARLRSSVTTPSRTMRFAEKSSGPTSPRFSCHSRIRAFSSCPMRHDGSWHMNLIRLVQSVKCRPAAGIQSVSNKRMWTNSETLPGFQTPGRLTPAGWIQFRAWVPTPCPAGSGAPPPRTTIDLRSNAGRLPIRADARVKLVTAIARGRKSGTATIDGIATREACGKRHVHLTISLAFLAPRLVKAAVDGRLPQGIGVAPRSCDSECTRQFQIRDAKSLQATSPIMRYLQIVGRFQRSGITWPTSGDERFGGAARRAASRGTG
jgi:hypothetical protein